MLIIILAAFNIALTLLVAYCAKIGFHMDIFRIAMLAVLVLFIVCYIIAVIVEPQRGNRR